MGKTKNDRRLLALAARGFDKELLKKDITDFEIFEVDELMKGINISTESEAEALRKRASIAVNQVAKYAKNFEQARRGAVGICMVGPPGIGKTMLVTSLVKRLWETHGIFGMLTYCDDLIKSVNAMWTDDDIFLKKYGSIDLLVVDNIPHTLHQSRSVFKPLESILRYRMKRGLPTIFICSVTKMEMSAFPKSLLSVMQQSMVFLDMDGLPDYRPKLNAEIKKLLED